VPNARLSPLDASFLEVESDNAHMHVGWVALFDPPDDRPAPTFHVLRRHIASRLGGAPRYRQKLAFVPLGVHDPVWIDDDQFDLARHVLHSQARDIDRLIEHAFSTPLRRDRALWELWIADGLADGRIGVVGKVHHCMVDGIAAVELASLFMDTEPDAPLGEAEEWEPAPPPGRVSLFAQAARDRFAQELELMRLPAEIVRSPRRVPGLVRTTARMVRSLAHTIMPVAPATRLN
jgi:diacylglycerol O-acyltransferase / wax synthase